MPCTTSPYNLYWHASRSPVRPTVPRSPSVGLSSLRWLRERDLAAQGGPSRQLHELNGTSPAIIIARNCVYKMRECHPTGGYWKVTPPGLRAPSARSARPASTRTGVSVQPRWGASQRQHGLHSPPWEGVQQPRTATGSTTPCRSHRQLAP